MPFGRTPTQSHPCGRGQRLPRGQRLGRAESPWAPALPVMFPWWLSCPGGPGMPLLRLPRPAGGRDPRSSAPSAGRGVCRSRAWSVAWRGSAAVVPRLRSGALLPAIPSVALLWCSPSLAGGVRSSDTLRVPATRSPCVDDLPHVPVPIGPSSIVTLRVLLGPPGLSGDSWVCCHRLLPDEAAGSPWPRAPSLSCSGAHTGTHTL